jgi:ABC-type uncharacterized transport system YnjBCD permease subunit
VPTRPAAAAFLVLLLLVAVAVPALVIADYVGRQVYTDQRISQLEQQVEQLTTDVSLMRE